MKFTLQREQLLKPLQLVTGVVERRQTLPVLSNLLVQGGRKWDLTYRYGPRSRDGCPLQR